MNMTPGYSIIIPAYNEEKWLTRTLPYLKKAMETLDVSGEVIVVDNNSTDGTARVACRHNARIVFEPVNQISRARNTGASIARGRYFIFLDADTFLVPVLLKTAWHHLSGGRCCGGGCLVDFDKPISAFSRKILGLWNWISITFCFAAGCFIFCRRDGFEAIGGFSENVYAGEEIWFSYDLRSWGSTHNMAFKIISAHRIITSSRKLDWFSPLQLAFSAMVLTIFPFSVRFRRLCSHWYYRPKMANRRDE
ncbi:MAG: glycosyltransferase [Deltaproteobacteria bacterium]|nr:glycosyltransferase [Deltaproteobacteria bacterium]MBW2013838.1 glycosyltransferase [Deltaproteobacteria bacterium]MBW2087371.1 glycosyltransferase [Deltaproteobacteria bacterium]MBW2320607.1 glycosyltransferase [Deltaproteobacteria bacterium]